MNQWNLLFTLTAALLVEPQQSLRQLAQEQGGRAVGVIEAEFGLTALTAVMNRADLVLHGQIADVRVHLSADESQVVTDYMIAPTSVIKEKGHKIVGTPITLRRPGGELTENGLQLSTEVNVYPESESFTKGEEVIVMLIYDPETQVYFLAGGPFGAFRVRQGKVHPMTHEVVQRRHDQPHDLATFLDNLRKGQP